MGQPTTLEATQTIGRHQWTTFLAKFTRENRGAHAELEILGGEIGRVVPLEDRPFDGIAADTKDGEDTVWMTFGSDPEDRLAHGIQKATVIRVRPPSGKAGAALEVEATDGTRTLLELSRPEAYALPPANEKSA
jgi:hypothetical protein